MDNTIKGAIAPPTEDPLSKNAVASARSCFGNHSATALLAAGQLADSPSPSKKRNPMKLDSPLASGESTDTREYQATVNVRPRRVPNLSISRPSAVWPMAYAIRNAMTMYAES